MATTSTADYSKCISLKCFVVFIGIWGLIVGAHSFVFSMAHSIMTIQRENTDYIETMFHVYGAIGLMLYEYVIVMMLVFSIYLLYGAFRECPEKSSYIMSWLIFAGMSDVATFIDMLVRLIRGRRFSVNFFMEEAILLCVQFGCIAIIYAYYRTLPKMKFHDT